MYLVVMFSLMSIRIDVIHVVVGDGADVVAANAVAVDVDVLPHICSISQGKI